MPPLPETLSRLTPIGYQSSDCGYCKAGDDTSIKTPNSRACYYASCKFISVQCYQRLVDRGWRRSGKLVYKPDVFRACCPHYTIRLPAASLAPSRDQRQTLYRWNKYVLGEDYIKEVTKRFPQTKEEKSRKKDRFDLVHTVHEAEFQNLKPVQPAHRFEVTLEEDTFTEEKFLLYKDYQVKVHHDKPGEVTQAGFKRFLCSSPLHRQPREENGKTQQLGSFHQCYRLDGKLIALAVLDLLPHAVSGVYFIYHSDFEKWSFGKLSAMREAAMALEGDYEFYYMGYYIHNCVKMRYKGDYKPQYVLDPEEYNWDSLDGTLRELLDRQKYVSLSRERRLASRASTTNIRAPPREPIEGSPSNMGRVEEEPEYQFPKPKDAANTGMSLLSIGMPGVPSAEELKQQINLDKVMIAIGRPGETVLVEASRIVSWEEGDILDASCLKGIIAEFAACIGSDAIKKVCLDFSA